MKLERKYTPQVPDAFASPGRLYRGLCQPASSKKLTTVVLEFNCFKKNKRRKQQQVNKCGTGLIRLATDDAVPEPKKTEDRRRKVDGSNLFFAVMGAKGKFQPPQ